MDLSGASGLWTVGSFLLGQSVIFGGVVLNNRAQARRERSAREADRQRTLADRRDTFELDHLQQLHVAISDLLVTGEKSLTQWIRWHGYLYRQAQQPGVQDDELERRIREIKDRAEELTRTADAHAESVSRLASLVIPDRLRSRVYNAYDEYDQMGEIFAEGGAEDGERALPDMVAALKAARRDVAERIREIHVAHDAQAVTATARRSGPAGRADGREVRRTPSL
ncbi:hypothetical protein AB0J38_12155 [Streptomyces sp. NPDC050095]|uniref:hypothetical protein n=1 Tax=unclassified Streptomyces TaxID=2593676 RepID=UPI00342EA757